MAERNEAAASTADREIVATRIFDAPRELVWKAWTDPKHVALWWGPNGFKNTISEMDVRPGGVWRFIMHGPDGTDYANRVAFLEVVRPHRLVYIHGDERDPDQFRVTVIFEEQDGKTKLTMRSVFRSAADLAYVVEKHGAIEGMNQTLGRLKEYLLNM
ncbi:MAG TPA: SRPBCC family protein [Micropepsaceae bacterium]|nr:SRPBCC family protein [Micropepsaceae bacterium]